MPLSPTSFDWTHELSPDIKGLDEIPLTGTAPPFPWGELASLLSQSFERDDITITPGAIAWRTKEDLFEGLGDSIFPLTFAIPSLQGTACWVMPEQEMANLESILLTKESHPLSFQDRALSEAFYRFLALETLYGISRINFDKTIAPILTEHTALPSEPSLCLDVSISIQGQTLWGRLVISQELRRSWIEHFAARGKPSALTNEMTKKVDIFLHLEAGRTDLTFTEWSKVAVGDLVGLDLFTLDRKAFTGPLTLTIAGKSAFKADLQEGKVKIVEISSYQEVPSPMAKNTPDDESNEQENNTDELEDLTEETLGDEEFELDEDLETEDLLAETPTTGIAEETAISEAPAKEVVKEKEAARPKSLISSPISTHDIPMTVAIEVGRIQMSMEKLLTLEPGNVLDLNVHPEDGVDLVVNGKTVGKGELVRIGEVLGVRVLELA